MKKTKSLRRLLAGVLAALMVLSALPVAFAADEPSFPAEGITVTAPEEIVLDGTTVSGNPTLTVNNPTGYTMTDVYLGVTGGTSVSVPVTIEPGTYSYPITGTSTGRQIIYALSYSLDGGEETYTTYGFSYTRSATTPVLAELRHHPSVGNWNDIDLRLTIDKGVINQTSVEGQGGAEVVSYSDLYIDRSQGNTWDALGLEFSYTLRTNHADRKKYYDIWVDQNNVATFGFGDVAATGVSKTGIKDKYFGDTTRFAGEYDGYAEYNLVYGNVPSVETMQFYFWFKFNAVDWLFGDKDGAHTLGKTLVTVHTVDKGALRDAIQAAAQKNYQAANFTADTFSTYLDAYTKANEVLSKYQSTQAEIDAAKAALDSAVAALKYADANYTALDAAITEAKAILDNEESENLYTAESLQNLKTQYDAAVALKAQALDFTHQSEIDAAAKALADAITGLTGFADYTDVAQAVAAFEKLNPSYYDAEDFAAVQALVDAARESMNNRLPATQQAEVDQMADKILDAMASLVKLPADYAALDALVAEAEKLYYNADNVYTPASITALETALLAAMDVQDADYTIDNQQLVDNAYTTLDNAMKAMVKLPADKDDLQTQVDAANAILVRADYKNYTDDSRKALEAALAAAQQILDDDSLTVDDQAKVQAAAENLAAAIRGLTLKGANYDALKAAIEARKAELEAAKTATVNDGDQLYTDASITRLSIAIGNAESVVALNLPITEQGKVDDAVSTLNSIQLEKNPADYSALNALIEEKQTELNNAGDEYTEASKAALQQAINTARTAVAQSYKIDEQNKVDDAVAALEAAELVLKGADYTALDNAVKAAEEFLADPETETLYDADAIQAVKDALEAAQDVDRELPITAQDTVDALETALNNAVENAKTDYNPAVLTGLNDAIAAAQAKLEVEDINDYTDESIRALEAAITEANALIEENPDITRQGEVDAMAEQLNGMELTLKPADKSGVQDAIDKGEEILDNREQYTDEYIDAVEEALDNLYEILDEELTIKEQDKVDGAIDAIDEIAENPSYVGANLDSLNAAIAAAEAKKAAPDYMNYTEASRQALEAKLQEAIALRDSAPDITQQQAVEDMAAALNAVELRLEDADYTALDAVVAEAEALLADVTLDDRYTLTSIEALKAAVTEAGYVERDQDVSYQDVIDAAAQAVRDAIAGLKEYNKIEEGSIQILGGDGREGDKIYHKTPWYQTYKSQKAELYVDIPEGVDVASIKWEAANWSVDEPEATITDNGDGTATIQPNGKGIGARSMWVKVTVTDVNGNVATDIVKVRFYNWNWQK